MDKKELLNSIDFFNKLTVTEEDVTTDQERADGKLVVKATYEIDGKSYTTPNLYYKEIFKQKHVNNPSQISNFFGPPVYWLDREIHDWPKGEGHKIEDRINEYMAAGNPDFRELLNAIANDNKRGHLQKITNEGRTQQYGFNLDNNNHWHDLILLIQAIINAKGEYVEKDYFKRLVFRWYDNKRLSLHSNFGSRLLIHSFCNNIKSIQMDLQIKDFATILEHKHQIILQGPPGTGKTYTAKDIAEQMIFGDVSPTKDDQKKRLEEDKHKRFKLIQFHPAYTYEDFVRGITIKPNGNSVHYETENRVLGDFSSEAAKNRERNYVLVIDEINRANLPAVLGELIYALEYRDHTVESMYKLNEDEKESSKLVLPKNLFIIGTMNTADRSVGHIDYAIRRRFAFKDMPPLRSVVENHYKDNDDLKDKSLKLYDNVEALFKKGNIASDFKSSDVQLGHSYFLTNKEDNSREEKLKLKLKYEIKPLLREYLKDGILQETVTIKRGDIKHSHTTEDYIENLKVE